MLCDNPSSLSNISINKKSYVLESKISPSSDQCHLVFIDSGSADKYINISRYVDTECVELTLYGYSDGLGSENTFHTGLSQFQKYLN